MTKASLPLLAALALAGCGGTLPETADFIPYIEGRAAALAKARAFMIRIDINNNKNKA